MPSTLSRAGRRHAVRAAVCLAAYVALTLAVHGLFRNDPPEGAVKWALAIAPALPVLALIGSVGVYLTEETDEFTRMVVARSLLAGIGVTLAVATVWDSLVAYDAAEPLRPFLLVGLFFFVQGLAQPIVSRAFR